MDQTKNIKQVLAGVRSAVDTLNANMAQAEAKAHDEKVSKFLQILYPHSYAERKDRNPKRIDGTCQWFTEHTLFNQWRDGHTANTLWVSADPGCGKSVLAKYLVDEVLSKENHTICYFFFKDDFADQRTACNAVRAMIHQLVSAQRTIMTAAILATTEAHGDKVVDSFAGLWSMFLELGKNLETNAICILDALDECQDGDRSMLIKAICENSSQKNHVKILVLGRPYFNIQNEFDRTGAEIPVLHLSGESDDERELISKEIDLVIRHRIQIFCAHRQLSKIDHDFLVTRLVSVPQKTYLWAHLTMTIIEDTLGFTRGDARVICENLPSSVNAAYEKILERSVDTRRTRLLLELVLVAKRPLKVDETCLLLALDSSQADYKQLEEFLEPEDRFKQTVRNLCGLFVVIVDGRLYLLHQTAREFLVGKKLTEATPAISNFSTPLAITNQVRGTNWNQSFSLSRSNRTMTERCVWLFRLCSDQIVHKGTYNYCAVYWTDHFKQSNCEFGDEFLDLVYRYCLTNREQGKSWLSVFLASLRFSERCLPNKHLIRGRLMADSHASTLMVACFFGLASLVERHFRGKWKQNWGQDTMSEALWSALYSDCVSTIEVLIKYGVDLNTACCLTTASGTKLLKSEFPIRVAVVHNSKAVVELLLQHGAKADILYYAEDQGYETRSTQH